MNTTPRQQHSRPPPKPGKDRGAEEGEAADAPQDGCSAAGCDIPPPCARAGGNITDAREDDAMVVERREEETRCDAPTAIESPPLYHALPLSSCWTFCEPEPALPFPQGRGLFCSVLALRAVHASQRALVPGMPFPAKGVEVFRTHA